MTQNLIQKHRLVQHFLEHFESTDPAVQAKAHALKDKIHKYWESYSSLVSGTYVSNEQALKGMRQDKEVLALLRAFKTGKQLDTGHAGKAHMRFHFNADTVLASDSTANGTNDVVSSAFRLSADPRRLPVANVGDSLWSSNHLLPFHKQAQTDAVSDYDNTASFADTFLMPANTVATYPQQSIMGKQQGIVFKESGLFMVTGSLDLAIKPRARFNFRTQPVFELIDQTHGKLIDHAKDGSLDDLMPKVGLGVMLLRDGYISKDVTASGNDATPWFNPALCRFTKVFGPWSMSAAGAQTGRSMRVGFSVVLRVYTGDNLLLSLMRTPGNLTMTGMYANQGQVVQINTKLEDAIVIAKSTAPGSARASRDLSNVLEITKMGHWV